MQISRSGWAVALLAAASVWWGTPDAASHVEALAGTDFPRALLALAALIQLGISSWVLFIVGASMLLGRSPVARTSVMHQIAPRVLRRALFVSTVGVLTLAPAHAEQTQPPPPTTHGPTSTHDLTGLRLPDRPSASPRSTPAPSRTSPVTPSTPTSSPSAPTPSAPTADQTRAVEPPDAPRGEASPPTAHAPQTTPDVAVTARPTSGKPVVVRQGDTLWAIAARSLPAGASARETAVACDQWFDTNRSVIGDNPHLIFPLQRLVPPSGKDPS